MYASIPDNLDEASVRHDEASRQRRAGPPPEDPVVTSIAERTLAHGAGILRLAPNWVPRAFCVPGRRLRLHPDDLFGLGVERGGIDERWLASTIRADNGPNTPSREGVSQVIGERDRLLGFDEVVAELGAGLIGSRLWEAHGDWPMFAKFFDNLWPLPLHVHHDDARAAMVHRAVKPEAYYYPPQMNAHLGRQPMSFFGLVPGTTREDVRRRLEDFGRAGDNRITELSTGYRMRLGAGWDIPTGVLHAPASLCTYEPQAASDVMCMCESWSGDAPVSPNLLWRDVPAERRGDLEFVLDLIDWDRNLSASFRAERSMAPIATAATANDPDGPASESWVAYRSTAFSATELTIRPGQAARLVDWAAYGCIVIQGRGEFGQFAAEAPTLLRLGEPSSDEFFVSEAQALDGVRIRNLSDREPLVLLKHFGPGNPALDDLVIPTAIP